MEIEMQANAKINLALDVLGERDDGFHNIDTVMQEIDLHDTLTLETGREGFVLFCDNKNLALDETNMVYKAWDALRDRVDNDAIIIELKKRIPLGAGLAGGSSDAMVVLKGLNELWSLDLSEEELAEIGLSLGSDLPFFVRGGTQRARGRGEVLTPLEDWSGQALVLIKPNGEISSKEVYDQVEANGKLPINQLVQAMGGGLDQASKLMKNHMETVSFHLVPGLSRIKEDLLEAGAINAVMTGSGPTIFGFFKDRDQARACEKKLKMKYPFVKTCLTI